MEQLSIVKALEVKRLFLFLEQCMSKIVDNYVFKIDHSRSSRSYSLRKFAHSLVRIFYFDNEARLAI